jgi:bacterioferritin (cytochrome b1)
MMQERLDSDLSLEAPVEKNMREIIQLNGEVCNPAQRIYMIDILINEEH